MNQNQYTYNQPPMGQGMPTGMPGMGSVPTGMPGQGPMGNRPRTWRERWMRRFGMDKAVPLTKGALTIPNWLTGKSMVFFFVAMMVCWFAFGFVPEFTLWMQAAISVVLFFYGGQAMSRSWERKKAKTFVRNIFIAGFIIRFLWVLYCYFIFNPEYYGSPVGDRADVEWYIPFAKDITEWLAGNSQYSFSELLEINDSAIDDTGYPMWLAIGYLIWGVENDIFMPFLVKCIVNAYCAVCIYRVAKRHFGEGVGRMAAIFVCLNPNLIYWCGTMFKEAEMSFLCCLFVDETDKALFTNRIGFKALLPGLLVGLSLFFFRAALGASAFLALFAHIVMSSNRVMSTGKKIIAGILVSLTLFVGIGDSLRDKTENMIEKAQTTEHQKENMEWRAEREGGNSFAKYASEVVFAPLIFTIPFPTYNVAYEGQLRQIQLAGGSYVKNIFSFFVLMVLFMLLISGEWRRHVFIIAYTCGYLFVLVFSNFAQSGRFHIPVIPTLMLLAAYGVQIAKTNARAREWFPIVLVIEVVVCLAWNWFKLAGRGML